MKKLVTTILLAMALQPINLLAQQCEVANTAFKEGESVRYDLYFDWGIIWKKVGYATFSTEKTVYEGQPAYDIETAEMILKKHNYDIVLGSVHNLRGGEDFYFMENLSLKEAEKLLYEYFNAIIEMLNWGNFDVLTHLTYPLRYFYSKSNLDIDLDKFKDQIDEVLTLAAKKGKALEINTAALRQPLNKLSPEVDIIKRFKELGGKYVSVGSDAHYAEHLSADIDMAYSAALEAGFDSITFFQKRTPMEMKIEMED